MIKSKRGWIRIVEAFIAVLLVTGVLLIFINNGYLGQGKSDYSEKIYNAQISILREIQLDPDLRVEILSVKSESMPVSSNLEGVFPQQVLNKINERVTEYQYLNCTASLCELDKVCSYSSEVPNKNIYAQAVAISAEPSDPKLITFSPRQLKLFCWTK